MVLHVSSLAPRPLPRPTTAIRAPRSRPDYATIAGVAFGLLLIGGAMAFEGQLGAFVDWPSLAIVFGGTLSVTAISYSWSDIVDAYRVLPGTFSRRTRPVEEAARLALQLADDARRFGSPSLQPLLPALRDEPFLVKGLTLATDGMPNQELEATLKSEVQATVARHLQGASVLRRAAEVAPAMGLIGALLGLVQMLGNLHDLAAVGPSLAAALLTMFYGIVLANVLLAPLASKLERNAGEEQLVRQIFLLAAASIGRQENPRRLEVAINAILPPAKQLRLFD